MSTLFADITPIRFEGRNATSPVAFRHSDANRMVLGKRMEDQLADGRLWQALQARLRLRSSTPFGPLCKLFSTCSCCFMRQDSIFCAISSITLVCAGSLDRSFISQGSLCRSNSSDGKAAKCTYFQR